MSIPPNQPPVLAMFAVSLVISLVVIFTSPSSTSAETSQMKQRQQQISNRNIVQQKYPQAILITPRRMNLAAPTKQTNLATASDGNSILPDLSQHIHFVAPISTDNNDGNTMVATIVVPSSNSKDDTQGPTTRKLRVENEAQTKSLMQNMNSSKPRPHNYGVSHSLLAVVGIILGVIGQQRRRGLPLSNLPQRFLNTILQRGRLESELAYDIAYTSDVSEVGYGSVASSTWAGDLDWVGSSELDHWTARDDVNKFDV